MSADDATAAAVRVVLRCGDREILSAAATARKQTLAQFVREVLEVAAVDLRTPPAPRLTWGDVYRRHPQPSPEVAEGEDEPPAPVSPRRARLSSGPTFRDR